MNIVKLIELNAQLAGLCAEAVVLREALDGSQEQKTYLPSGQKILRALLTKNALEKTVLLKARHRVLGCESEDDERIVDKAIHAYLEKFEAAYSSPTTEQST